MNHSKRLMNNTLKYLATIFLFSLLIAACGLLPKADVPTPLPTFAAPANEPTLTPFAPEAAAPTAEVGSAQLAESTLERVRFAIIGDYGLDGQAEADVAALVKGWEPDFILTTGDNNYEMGAVDTIDANIGQYYHEYIAPYSGSYGAGAESNRFFPVLGNHDWRTPDAQPYLDYFALPGNERYYEFAWGPLHFFALDSDSNEPDGVGMSSAQAAWLQGALAASRAPWQIVYFHHPPYSSGVHGSIDWMRWPFETWGASAVISGHDHIYERLAIGALPYFINGLGGGPRYEFGAILPESQVRYNSAHGAMLVEADAAEISFQFITINGEMIDSYTLPPPETAPDNVQALPDAAQYQWAQIVQGLTKPVGLTHAGDGSGRLFIIEQPGTIRIWQNGELLPTPFLDIRARINDGGSEQGFLGLAFSPGYAQNGYFFTNYTNARGDTVIARYRASADPNLADPASEEILLTIKQPYGNHNGGHLAFGPDGYLYIGTGDGGSANDPEGNAQNLNTLLGKMLRLNVDTIPYTIPADNPFGTEIWAYGLRNPWRYAFDRATGDLYIGDVGQNQWEEIDFIESGAPAGANLGWDVMEASHPFEGTAPEGIPLNAPVAEYNHTEGCSVTGGVVYRGALPAWQGVYLYGDFCSGRVWALLRTADGNWQNAQLFETGVNISAFGEDEAGEVYLADLQGRIFRLEER